MNARCKFFKIQHEKKSLNVEGEWECLCEWIANITYCYITFLSTPLPTTRYSHIFVLIVEAFIICIYSHVEHKNQHYSKQMPLHKKIDRKRVREKKDS